jgi:chromate reductase, NAD(P)H dehydrogenase (quinone)
MILIISGTNRKGSNTLKVAKHYEQILIQKGEKVQLLSLEEMKQIHKDYIFIKLEKEFLIPATKFIILSPEYNGTFPGILKLMIDLCDLKTVFYGKKAALVGIANGRAGNLRGLDHLTNALNYIKVNVMPNKLPISGIAGLLHETDNLVTHNATVDAMTVQIDEFINF